MKQRILQRQAGLTLVELLVTMGLMSLLLVVITDIFAATMELRTAARADAGLTQDGRFILARLNYDVARASAIMTPVAFGASGTSLTLTIDGVTTTYAVTSGALQLADINGTVNLNSSATTVTNFTVQKVGNSGGTEQVRISMTLTATDRQKSGPQTQTLTTTIGRR